jgi:hypothetical protein
MDKAEALFVYDTAGRLLAAEINGFCNVHGKSPDPAARQTMLVMATDTALQLWRDVLARSVEVQAAKPPPPRPAPSEPVRTR